MMKGDIDVESAPDAARPILESAINIAGSMGELKLAFGALLGYADFVGDEDNPPPTTRDIVVDTGSTATINGVMVRGMDAFKVYTSDERDGTYTIVTNTNDGNVFMGDASSNDPLLIEFPIPVVARFVRIIVRRWNETFEVPLTEEEVQAQLIEIVVDKFNRGEDPYVTIEPPIGPSPESTIRSAEEITNIYTFVGEYLMITKDIVIEDAPETARPILESAVEIAGSLEDLKLAFEDVFVLLE